MIIGGKFYVCLTRQAHWVPAGGGRRSDRDHDVPAFGRIASLGESEKAAARRPERDRNEKRGGIWCLLDAFRSGNPLQRIAAQTSCRLPTQVVNGRYRSHQILRCDAVLSLSPALGSWASGGTRAARREHR
jgi:hypothetical protein